jgi:sensor histidine kinase YesM
MNFEKIIHKVYTHRWLRITLHVLFWVVLFLIKWYTIQISFNSYKYFPDQVIIWLSLTDIINFILFYYPFVYYVLPRLFAQKKWIAGIASTLVLVVLYTLLAVITEQLILLPCVPCMQALKEGNSGYAPYLQRGMLNGILSKIISLGIFIGLFFSLCIPLIIKTAIRAFRQQVAVMQLAKDNIQLELNFLKSQVNPHFLFNSLNNIYGLILNNEKEKSAQLVARLSAFLRYSLYDSNQDKVAVEKELRLLKDYAELESIRLNHTKVTFTSQIDEPGVPVASLLMIPVVENAFKYSADNKTAYIHIDFQVAHKNLQVRIENTVDPDRQLHQAGGIGLQNFRKRLELYYPGRYTYTVTGTETTYIAIINIDLS